jgi:L-ascorbate metabolism protein UlaG (beta-lactamase superfamily)
MRHYAIIISLFCILSQSFSQISKNQLEITSIANEGFLLATPTHKILIDALFTDGYGTFAVPSKELIDKIMNWEAPFDRVDLLMLTHYHKDHCDPILINKYLGKHKNVRFVTSLPSIVFIDGNCFGFIGKKKQFDIITPELNHNISEAVNTMPVKAFGLKHLSFYNKDSIDLEQMMFNTSFLVEMDGIKIFHSGDIERNAFQDYLNKNKWTDSVDVAFLYNGLLKSGKSDLEYILNTLHPRYIVVMHVLPKETEAWSEKIKSLKAIFPNILYLKSSMESEIVTIDKK